MMMMSHDDYYNDEEAPHYSQATERVLDTIDQFRELTEVTYEKQRTELESILESLKSIENNDHSSIMMERQQSEEVAEDEQEEEEPPQGNDEDDNNTAETTSESQNDDNNDDDDLDDLEFMKMMQGPQQVECDVCIVGGGPAGCSCALYTSRARLSTVILDKNPATGALAITSHIANYPGVDKSITGEELLGLIRSQAIDYGADYRRLQVFMIDIEQEENESNDDNGKEGEGRNIYTVYTPDAIFKARTLVLATGAMGRVQPPFPGEDTFLGQGVSYCATCDGAFYKDADVAVKGMNLEAMEEAQFLTKFAKKVHWVTPHKPKPSDSEQVQELLAAGNVQKWPTTRLLSVEGDPLKGGVTGIQVKQKDKDESEIIPVEGVFIYAGGSGGSKPITDYVDMGSLGRIIQYKEDGGVVTNEAMETNVKGVYAIGDIRNTSYKQVVVAAADGCIAAMSIDKYLKGRNNVKVDWIHK